MRLSVGNNHVVQEQELLVVRPASGETYGTNYNICTEDDAKIPKMEAVCKKCWKILVKEDYAVMKKVNCKCRFNLIHKRCETAWSAENQDICPLCKQMAHRVSVTLSPMQASARNKQQRFSCFKF